jgi:hypothetical protein
MSREWKPGDVAMIEVGCHANRHVGVFTGAGWRYGDERWVADDAAIVTVVRPLVVIDPEDREAVERLVHVFSGQRDWYADTVRQRSDAMQDALREFANPTPPKPDEPQGLGAVVQREDGIRWVRGERGWTNLDAQGRFLNWSNWSEVNELSPVTTVLSPGVTS